MKDEILLAIGERVAGSVGTGPDEERMAAQKRAVEALSTRRPRWGMWAGVAAAAAVILLVLSVVLVGRERPMEFWVGSGLVPGAVGQWVEGEATLRFADGGRVELEEQTLVRVSEASTQGVLLALDHGKVGLSVPEGGKAVWSVAAGQYVVTVTGTQFTVSWDGRSLEVEVERGEVLVQGPGGEGTVLEQGGYLHLGARPEVQEPVEAPVVEEIEAPVDEAVGQDGDHERPRAPKPAGAPVPEWKQLAGEGKFEEAVEAAQAEGFEKLLESLGPSDLWELADASRYAKEGQKALLAYAAYRKRFPDTKRASTAAFLMGRVEMETMGRPDRAAGWFETYLEENPHGPLAEEALGRLIKAHIKAGNDAEAGKAAQSYLSSYPEGIFKELAGSVLAR